MKSLLERPIATGAIRKPRKTASRPRRFNCVLVPIDFSRVSLKAMPYALAISRQFGADVRLLHVVDVSQQPPPTLLTLPLVPQAECSRRLLKRLEGVVLTYRSNGSVTALKPCTGTAYEEICVTARRLHADLIVIATHGYTGYKRAFLGSTVERVVQHAPCPVLVVRLHAGYRNGALDPGTRTGFELKKILVPIDFSECSRVGFNYALQLARDFKAELQLLHVLNPHWYPFGDQYAALDASQLMAKASHAAQQQMMSMAAKSKVRYAAGVIYGSPAIKICDAANKEVDLIVISTHGRSGVGHLLIGSVAEHVVRYAHCPVLVIPSRPTLKLRKERRT